MEFCANLAVADMSNDRAFDILVVAAGPAGLAAALAFARDGFETCLVGTPDARRNGRTVALLDGSVRFLQALGMGPLLVLQSKRIACDHAAHLVTWPMRPSKVIGADSAYVASLESEGEILDRLVQPPRINERDPIDPGRKATGQHSP